MTMFTGLVGFPSTKVLMGCLDLSLSGSFAMPGGSRVIRWLARDLSGEPSCPTHYLDAARSGHAANGFDVEIGTVCRAA